MSSKTKATRTKQTLGLIAATSAMKRENDENAANESISTAKRPSRRIAAQLATAAAASFVQGEVR